MTSPNGSLAQATGERLSLGLIRPMPQATPPCRTSLTSVGALRWGDEGGNSPGPPPLPPQSPRLQSTSLAASASPRIRAIVQQQQASLLSSAPSADHLGVSSNRFVSALPSSVSLPCPLPKIRLAPLVPRDCDSLDGNGSSSSSPCSSEDDEAGEAGDGQEEQRQPRVWGGVRRRQTIAKGMLAPLPSSRKEWRQVLQDSRDRLVANPTSPFPLAGRVADSGT